MKDRDRLRIGDLKLELCEAQDYECACGCGARVTADQCDLAHRIPQTQSNLKTYGKRILHHRLNLGAVPAGRLDCNKRIEIGRAHFAERQQLLYRIMEAIEHDSEG